MLREVRMALLEADVALPVVKDSIARVREKAVGQDVVGSLNPGAAGDGKGLSARPIFPENLCRAAALLIISEAICASPSSSPWRRRWRPLSPEAVISSPPW